MWGPARARRYARAVALMRGGSSERAEVPQKCPKCGLFLSNDFVRRTQQRPQAPGALPRTASCPHCNTTPTAEPAPAAGAGSVRPPDLPPAYVHDDGDVLAGWDEAAPRRGRRRLDSDPATGGYAARPTPGITGPLRRRLRRPKTAPLAAPLRSAAHLPALAIVASAGLAGGFAGALLVRQRRSLGAAVGTLAGAGAAVAGVNLRDQRGVDV